jgi:hypothetical protein
LQLKSSIIWQIFGIKNFSALPSQALQRKPGIFAYTTGSLFFYRIIQRSGEIFRLVDFYRLRN